MRLLYSIGILLYAFGVRVAAFFGHKKAQKMVRGWHDSPFSEYRFPFFNRPTVWFHASSLGEFEQARPVMERYRQLHPDHRILLTFFSPSGFEVRKNYEGADAVCYLPPDTLRNARRLVSVGRPVAVFFVKYDFWFNYLHELRDKGVPIYLFSAIFRPQQYFFQPWGKWYLQKLRDCYRHIFVQDEASLQLLQQHGVKRCSIAGDTRFDRVHQIAEAAERNEVVEAFLVGYDGKVLVCGSTWPPDEKLLANASDKEWWPARVIIAPHLINEEHLQQIEKLFPNSVRYSVLKDSKDLKGFKVLIIDNIGMLSKLYRYADVAYIGGGFGVGIHNILEAVTFGKPVIFGPNYRKFKEAHDIIARGGGWSIHNGAELATGCLDRLLTDADAYRQASEACRKYMEENLGSTDIIIRTVES